MLIVHYLSSAGEHTEYTAVPLSDLDIAAADSLTLSPHNGKFCLSVAHWTDWKWNHQKFPLNNVMCSYSNISISQNLASKLYKSTVSVQILRYCWPVLCINNIDKAFGNLTVIYNHIYNHIHSLLLIASEYLPIPCPDRILWQCSKRKKKKNISLVLLLLLLLFYAQICFTSSSYL